MKPWFVVSLVVSLLGTYRDVGANERITVMTQNQYLGADLTGVITAPNLAAFNQAVVAALAQIEANNFPERAQALAKEIADRDPEWSARA